MKKILSMILCLIMVLGIASIISTTVTAEEWEAAESASGVTGDCWWQLNGTVLTIGGNGKMGDYHNINNPPPWRNTTRVIIENGVTNIGEFAFTHCVNLDSISIPDSVTRIEDSAFNICSKLTSISIPDSVDYIGEWTFDMCSKLTDVKLPASLTKIEHCTFYGCGSLTNITIPATVTEIGNSAFYNCKALSDITIPDSVRKIGQDAFFGCQSLKSITIPYSVKTIGFNAFGYLKRNEKLADFTIYGYSHSEAEKYAKENDLSFVSLGENPDYAAGDVDGDGVVSVMDATKIQKFKASLIKENEINTETADVDGDGIVTVMDATRIQKFKAKLMNLDGSVPFAG